MSMTISDPVRIEIEAESQNTSPVTSEPKSYLSRFFERGFKYFGAGAATNIISIKTMLPFMSSGMDWCPELPKPLYTYASYVCRVREYLPGLTGTYDTQAFKCPIVEELMFRVGLQEIILKKIPQAILTRLAPSHVGLVNTKIAKVARVTLATIAFSLAHAMPSEMGWPNCSTARLVNTFVFGLLIGGIQEITESPLAAMLFHSGFNLQSAYFTGMLGASLSCPSA